MYDFLNSAAAVATIVFGAIGWFAPRYTMDKLDLATDGSTLGVSEIRAANGALFVSAGVMALIVSTPTSFLMLGALYAGAALGRGTSIALDNSGQTTSYTFIAAEVGLALWLLGANGPALMG